MEVSGESHVPAALFPQEVTPVQWNRRLSGRCEEEGSLLSLPEYESHIVKAVDQSLYRLSYPGQMFNKCRVVFICCKMAVLRTC